MLAVTLLSAAASAGEYSISIVAEGLEYPWSLAFLPNGEMLVTERAGRLRMIRNDDLLEYEVRGIPEVYVAGQGGLFDILVDPAFSENELVYISYAAGSMTSNALHVIRARLDGASLVDVTGILSVRPQKNTPNHYGGRLAMLPDGTLLVSSGEGFDFREQAQSLSSMMGKLLRINTDGSVPADNPFAHDQEAAGEVFSYGHRNPQGIVVTEGGLIWMHEHGPRGGDELNLVEAGKNYGWPAITYGMDYSGAYVSPFTEAAGMEQPRAYWLPSIGPSGMTEYRGDAFPEWQGNLFVSSLVEKSVRRITLDGSTVVSEDIMFTELKQRIRDVRTGPDGYLYLLTDSESGQILRVLPQR